MSLPNCWKLWALRDNTLDSLEFSCANRGGRFVGDSLSLQVDDLSRSYCSMLLMLWSHRRLNALTLCEIQGGVRHSFGVNLRFYSTNTVPQNLCPCTSSLLFLGKAKPTPGNTIGCICRKKQTIPCSVPDAGLFCENEFRVSGSEWRPILALWTSFRLFPLDSAPELCEGKSWCVGLFRFAALVFRWDFLFPEWNLRQVHVKRWLFHKVHQNCDSIFI